MLTDDQKKFINKCEMTVGSQPYSEVLRLVDIIKELDGQNDKLRELASGERLGMLKYQDALERIAKAELTPVVVRKIAQKALQPTI